MLLAGKFAQRSIIRKLTKYSDAVVHIPVFYTAGLGLISPDKITKVTDIFVVYLGPI